MNENISNLAISQIRSLLRKRELSSLELTKYYLNNIEQAKTLNAYSFVPEELAISHELLYAAPFPAVIFDIAFLLYRKAF